MKTAIQQMMIGPLLKNYEGSLDILKKIKEIGYDGIELNSYMIHKTPFIVRMLTSLAKMPSGNGGKFDWESLIKESNLLVPSLHTDLGSLENRLEEVIEDGKKFNVKYLVVTGMYRFDYSDEEVLLSLSSRLNEAGKKVKEKGLNLLYHNHNVEFFRLPSGELSYDFLVKDFDPNFVGLEFDSYWATECGINVYSYMRKLGSRIKLHHINDRGFKALGPYMTPIISSDSMELGSGCMDIDELLKIDKEIGVEYVILETHRNFIDNSRMKSIEVSGKFLKNRI